MGYNLLIRPRVQFYSYSVLNIINGNFRLVRSWQKSLRPIGARVLFVPFWSHSKLYIRAQLEWPKRLTQLDNQFYIRRETYRISLRFSQDFDETFIRSFIKIVQRMKWFVCECWTLFILSLETNWETTHLGH